MLPFTRRAWGRLAAFSSSLSSVCTSTMGAQRPVKTSSCVASFRGSEGCLPREPTSAQHQQFPPTEWRGTFKSFLPMNWLGRGPPSQHTVSLARHIRPYLFSQNQPTGSDRVVKILLLQSNPAFSSSPLWEKKQSMNKWDGKPCVTAEGSRGDFGPRPYWLFCKEARKPSWASAFASVKWAG